jgi:hypothetical protein
VALVLALCRPIERFALQGQGGKMSFIISVYTHEGIIMAGDSRLTLNTTIQEGGDPKEILFDFSNSARKVFCTKNGIGISCCGDAGIEGIPLAGYIEEFLYKHTSEDIEALAEKLLRYLSTVSPGLRCDFHICGYKEDGAQRILRVSTFSEKVERQDIEGHQGAIWDGEKDIFTRIVKTCWLTDENGNPSLKLPYYQIPFNFFTLQDAIDFAIFAMNATIGAIRFQNRIKTVGGPIDILSIKKSSTCWIQRKQLSGEHLV